VSSQAVAVDVALALALQPVQARLERVQRLNGEARLVGARGGHALPREGQQRRADGLVWRLPRTRRAA
jgi:hypothetical protein